jgi:DNA-binding GntR family transcriptional regulator
VINIKYKIDISNQSANINIGDFTYKTLKDNIISWNLKPGTMMSEKEVSIALNVSRTPVREAFIKMSKEGLVDILPQRGTVVSKIDLNRVEEERFIRESLELSVFKLAASNLPKETCLELEKNIEEQAECLNEEQHERFFQLDEEFHKIIFSACAKELCWEVIQNVSGHYKRMRVMTLWNKKSPIEILDQHRALLDCIKNNDVQEAHEVLKRHLCKLKDEELEMKQKYPEYFK